MSTEPIWIPTPEPGIYPGIPAETYHKWDAMSNSWLKLLADASPKHFHYRRGHPKAPTKSMLTGTLLHKLCLERHHFPESYAVAPVGLQRTATKKWAAFLEANAPKRCITATEFAQACGMADGIMGHGDASTLLMQGEPEVSIVWDNEEFGVRCKLRLDYLARADKMIGDIKSTSDGDDHAVSSSVNKYGYHRQAGFYLDGTKAVGLDIERFILIFVESEPPYDAYAAVLDTNALQIGRHEYKNALRIYQHCVKTGQWPGRHETDVPAIPLPRWVLQSYGIRAEGVQI